MLRQFAPARSSSSLHSEACNALGASDGVIHSRISWEAICCKAIANAEPTYSLTLMQVCVCVLHSHICIENRKGNNVEQAKNCTQALCSNILRDCICTGSLQS